ncbi:hypothetical protein [Fodinicola feengrottensis]|uniref:Uncharacterized protein n=1 Tax=Fodinicola feengrottensis TaxID=435914 RepID=A0ABN2J0Y3_9ACTN|nr:hypothetical protein [Fodinicola feengrottensis]
MTWQWQEVIGTAGAFVLIISVVTVTIWQVGATRRAKALLAAQHDYRDLAERVARTQENTEKQLTALAERMADVQARMGSVERILKDVE